ncbi:N-6 DNA methylase, partial [Roseateles sp. GG27B]
AQSALCNPPYVRPKWRKHFGQILEEAGLSGVFPRISSVPADILFVAQNLRFLQSGGKLGLILPDGMIAGEKCFELRKALASSHHLERVIELPRRIFRGTDAKAYIVVLTKHGMPADEIELRRLESDGSLTGAVHLDMNRAGARMDYSFHAPRAPNESERSRVPLLRDLVESVGRGAFSSSERKLCGFPVFHTTDF